MTRRQIAALGLLILCTAAGSLAKDKEKANIRSVEGVVADGNGNPIAGAIVQLKNNKTLQVRSFVALQDGRYYFHDLSTNVDYELKARRGSEKSDAKRLSQFNSQQNAEIDLRIRPKS